MDQEQLHWIKSSYSGGSGTECVEVTALAGAIGVRDSKRPRGPRMELQRNTWLEFIRSLRQSVPVVNTGEW
ncbi:DUF397 domain-containing protein [Streptomyces sp. NPDC052052]|uniref:DUF397 domain-containing protein n=1 Tax=Streptomyces sp. NPDC052052 TaxID=3154756 RepID=UPI00341CBDAB